MHATECVFHSGAGVPDPESFFLRIVGPKGKQRVQYWCCGDATCGAGAAVHADIADLVVTKTEPANGRQSPPHVAPQ